LNRLPAVESDEAARGEVVYRTPSGQQRTFDITGSALIMPDRGLTGFVYTFNDLTEIRRLEREVRMRDRLSAVGRMAAGIAHEIRNPLSSISGSVKVLSRISALNEEQHMLVDIVTRESERLNRIIGDFLAYSRDKNLKMSRVDLVALLEDTLTLLANHPQVVVEGGQPRIRVLRDFQVNEAPAIADGDKMKQVFWNVCENGVRALSKGGVLTVSLMADGANWLIKFTDNGPGIKAQQMEKIFEPFQSGFEGGTGLGLAMVYQIVEAHGGEISARSTPGQGAEFFLRLAMAEAAGTLTADKQAELSQAATPSIAEAAAERPKAKVAHG
jgi:two-component system sensor histidine kinase PilS (NtrC family)